ncbi:hypothetical protein MHBO_003128 [Bonamia ostreae]|uniref:Uncharacterized protein n=1 Tax=Bonamia ostreae TaxID=126728 RepID=A0ABV2API9_9EUKA
MELKVELVLDACFPDLVNSRMMEIFESSEDMEPPDLNCSIGNLCIMCKTFSAELSDCHICGYRFCPRCVWYFILPDKFYPKGFRKNC